jgi:hypothetical protein
MKAVVISYNPGMFGEFFSSLLSESDSRFFNTDSIVTTKENRFIYPNYLSPVNLDIKNIRSDLTKITITEENRSTLHALYGDKWICVPTHWSNIDIDQIDLPCIGIRLYCKNTIDFNLSYCMWWLKSHLYASHLWPSRESDIKELILSGHKFKKEFLEMLTLGNFYNWKFNSYRDNLLKNETLDLKFYMFLKYHQMRFLCPHFSRFQKWITLDIGELIHRYENYDRKIESALNLENSLNLNKINSYREKNLSLLKELLNLNYEDLVGDQWLICLYHYCHNYLKSSEFS